MGVPPGPYLRIPVVVVQDLKSTKPRWTSLWVRMEEARPNEKSLSERVEQGIWWRPVKKFPKAAR